MTAERSISALEAYADRVVLRIAGPQEGEFGLDLSELAELISQIIIWIGENCIATDARIVRAVQKPNRRQRAKFKANVYGHCSSCATYRWRQESGNIAQAMMTEMGEMSESDILALVFEARHDDWVLV